MTTSSGEGTALVSEAVTKTATKSDKKKKKHKKKRKKDKRKLSDVDTHEESPLTKQGATDGTSKIAPSRPSERHDVEASKATANKRRKREARPSQSAATVTETESTSGPPNYSFQVDETDHCETPVEAYRDLLDVLDKLCESLNKTRANLQIYDPYYCNGGVKRKLESLGFESVVNRNRDFYQDIENQDIPAYDVLITNPPYSGIHMEKLLSFVNPPNKKDKTKLSKGSFSSRNTPWLFLLPHFVYTKDYYHRALKSKPLKDQIYFLVPEVRYSYVPPSWVEDSKGSTALAKGKTKTAPFPSFWYCYTGNKFPKSWLVETYGPTGSFRSKHPTRKLRYASCSNDIPRDFKGEFDKTKKRPNPKARKRAAKKRRDAMTGGAR